MSHTEHRRRHRRGISAETLCLWYLRLHFYRILAHRFRSPAGEIDIIARRGGVVAFIEVKARRDHADAVAAISSRQRRRIRRAAEHFLSLHPQPGEPVLRFDVMAVAPRRLPHHIIDAWRE